MTGHMTPRTIAEWHIRNWVGRRYESDSEVMNAGNDVLMIGLLHLILEAVEKTGHDKEADEMNLHANWLNSFKPQCDELREQMSRQLARLEKMAGQELPQSARRGLRPSRWTIGSIFFRRNPKSAWDELERCRQLLKKMKSIKTINDLRTLPGVGRKTLQKIKQSSEAAK